MAEAGIDPLPSPPLSTCRPWSEFISLSQLSLPVSLSDATSRLSRNLSHFRPNYALISLLLLLLSLLFHPIALLLLLATLAAWFFLYFYRSTPLYILNREIDDRVILVVLSLVAIFALVFASVWLNLLFSGLIAAAFICLHGVLRVTEFPDDPYGGLLYSVVDDPNEMYSEF